MPKSLHLHIPVPCHEDWSAMQPEEQGRHCAACQKTVVDFTAMSDAQVVAYMSRAGSQVCGRFAPDQLGRKLEEPAPVKRNRWVGWQLVLAGALLTADGSKRDPTLKGMIVPMELMDEKPTVGNTVPVIVEDTVEETKIRPVECHGELMGKIMVDPETPGDSMLERAARLVRDTAVADTSAMEDRMGLPIVLMDSGRANDPVDTSKRPVIDSIKQLVTDTLKKLNLLPAPKTLTLYPNPVPHGSSFRIVWPEEAGTYQAALYTTGGRLIQQRVITVTGPGQTDEWPLPGDAPAGIYVLQVNGKGSRYSQKVVVQ